MAKSKRPRRGLGRAIGDAAVTIGMAAGVSRRNPPTDALAANQMLIEQGKRQNEERSSRPAIIDRLPGWIVLILLGAVLLVTLIVWEWQ